jgi:uncharacterized damage-inducible protein DinB
VIERVDPGLATDELTTLTEFLDWYRATVFIKVDGLTEAQARIPSTPPSGLNLLGIVRHMADVERSWFRRRFAGEMIDPIFYTPENPDGDMFPEATATLADAVAALQAEIDIARRIASEATLPQQGLRLIEGHPVSMRWILVHMIEEYARHCGHMDLIREAIDGVTGD